MSPSTHVPRDTNEPQTATYQEPMPLVASGASGLLRPGPCDVSASNPHMLQRRKLEKMQGFLVSCARADTDRLIRAQPVAGSSMIQETQMTYFAKINPARTQRCPMGGSQTAGLRGRGILGRMKELWHFLQQGSRQE